MQTQPETDDRSQDVHASLRARRAEPASTSPDYTSLDHLRRSRTARRAGVTLIGVALLLGLLGYLGPSYTAVSATRSGVTMTVGYPKITRPGLATRWWLDVHRPDGFDGKIEVTMTTSYLEQMDHNAFFPEPASEVSRGDLVVLTFDPPSGDTLHVELDARTTPTWTFIRRATTSVSGSGIPELSVSYRTVSLP
jgi:hypothetical protein